MDSIDALDALTEILRGKRLKEKEAELALRCRHTIMNAFVGACDDRAVEALNDLTYLLGLKNIKEREAEVAMHCRGVLMSALQGISSQEVYISMRVV